MTYKQFKKCAKFWGPIGEVGFLGSKSGKVEESGSQEMRKENPKAAREETGRGDK
jgi:hypothetical protein